MTDFEKKWEEFCRGEIKFNWSRYGKELVKDFVESERKDLIENTNKRWREKIGEKAEKRLWTNTVANNMHVVKKYHQGINDLVSDLLEDTYKGEVGDLWEVGLPKDHPIFEDKK